MVCESVVLDVRQEVDIEVRAMLEDGNVFGYRFRGRSVSLYEP